MDKDKKTYRTKSVRLWLFAIWLISTLVYSILFFSLGATVAWIDNSEATEIGKRSIFLALPVLAAFGAFWFSLDESAEGKGHQFRKEMEFEEVFALWALTLLVHLISLAYLIANLLYLEKTPFPDESQVSFQEVGATFVDLIVILSPLSYLPVEFLTRRKIGNAFESSNL